MPCRIFFFLLGFGLMVIGCMFIILYANLMTIGYDFYEYINFICNRLECLLFILGFVIIGISIYWEREDAI